MARLVIVSNRVPLESPKGCAGGLAVALEAALKGDGGLWFGWSGRISEHSGPTANVDRGDGFTLATVDLSKDEHHGYYEEFSNRTLWPLFHGRLDLCQPDTDAYKTYRKVNHRFATTLSSLLQPTDTIWIQDYHLMPLGRDLRILGATQPLGFFLHVPFPQTEILAALPWFHELLSNLCAFDLIGFQTSACAENFREALRVYLGGHVRRDGSVVVDGHVVETDVFPVGIDTRAFKKMSQAADVQRLCGRLRKYMGGRDWACGVDRLDYTKGLAERFRAFETLLERAPELHNRVSLVQIAAPSRTSVAEYRAMQRQLEALSGQVNGLFGAFDWTPIRYLNRAFTHAQITALYRVSRIGLITPLRDGMNLVAKEYIAAQDPDDPGVLILSRFAGASKELTDALLVNPHDTDAVAQSLIRALQMPLEERQHRWQRMMFHIEANDVHNWYQNFVERLTACRSAAALREVA